MANCHYWPSCTQASTLKPTLIGQGYGKASYYSTLDKFAIIEGGSKMKVPQWKNAFKYGIQGKSL
jgi:hypothetical protein